MEDVLDFQYSGYFFVYNHKKFFCLQLQKVSENAKKTKRLKSKEEIEEQLIESMINNDITKTQERNEKKQNRETRVCCCCCKTIRRHYSDQKERYYIHRVSSSKCVQNVQGQGKVYQTSQCV